MATASIERRARTEVVSVPCERRLTIGDRAVLYRDTIYCHDCFAMMLVLGSRPIEFTLRRGATCGGGAPLG